MRPTLLAAMLSVLFGCRVITPNADPPEPPFTVVETTDGFSFCRDACKRLSELGCPEALTPDGGRSCYQLCTDIESNGKFALRPGCVSAARTVDQVRACGTVRCR